MTYHPSWENYLSRVNSSTNVQNMQRYQLLQTRVDQHQRTVATLQQVIWQTYSLEWALKWSKIIVSVEKFQHKQKRHNCKHASQINKCDCRRHRNMAQTSPNFSFIFPLWTILLMWMWKSTHSKYLTVYFSVFHCLLYINIINKGLFTWRNFSPRWTYFIPAVDVWKKVE